MNCSNVRISLDIHRNCSSDAVYAKRGDIGRRICITLTDGAAPYRISDDCTAVFTAKKPDNNVLYNDCSVQGDTIIYDVTEQTTAVAGRLDCEIKLYGSDGKLITSPKFILVVLDTVYDEGDEVESSSEFSALTAAMVGVEKLKKDGLKGDDGDSAYEVAAANGFEGTEEEWLKSLKGDDGKDGSPGKDGKAGADGNPGKDGADGYSPSASVIQTADGASITVTDKSGTTTAIIVNGKDGKDGKDGNTGDAVLYTAQTLTQEQQTQARSNIGAKPGDLVVDAVLDTEVSDGVMTGTADRNGVEIAEYALSGGTVVLQIGTDRYTHQPASSGAERAQFERIEVSAGGVKHYFVIIDAAGNCSQTVTESVAEIPTQTSQLANDSGFITKAVADLENYYRKDETYTQEEVNALVSAIPKFTISVVSALPTADISETTVYLVGGGTTGDLYTEYIYVGGAWEILGSQRIDLTDYARKDELPKAVYVTVTGDAGNGYTADKTIMELATAFSKGSACYCILDGMLMPLTTIDDSGVGFVLTVALGDVFLTYGIMIGNDSSVTVDVIETLSLPNPNALTVNGVTYDGSAPVDMTAQINALITAQLGVIENGAY